MNLRSALSVVALHKQREQKVHATYLLSDRLLRYAVGFGGHIADVVEVELSLDPGTMQLDRDVCIAYRRSESSRHAVAALASVASSSCATRSVSYIKRTPITKYLWASNTTVRPGSRILLKHEVRRGAWDSGGRRSGRRIAITAC